MTTPRPDSRLGTDLGPYHIETVIGRGGMGVVYLATDTDLDRRVALKLLAHDFVDDESFRARFLRESKMAAAIDHPNIIPIYEAGEFEGTFFLAMRYVDGADLEARLHAGPLPPKATARILGQVASALDAAHAAGLVHRDVKPANLLIASGQGADRDDHVYLTDFGLTKQRGSETGLTRTGSFLGTVDYIAPEQIEGKPVDGRADQYALASVAVICLTGQAPFPRDSDVATINAHLRDAPPSLHARRAELDPAADAVIARAMAKKPADRYPDCRAFVDELRTALHVGESETHARPDRAVGRRRTLIAASSVAVVAIVVGVALILGARSPNVATTPSASGVAVASASPTSEASPTQDVFPNSGEEALLRALPEALRATCLRGSYGLVDSDMGEPTRPLVSLDCSPPGSSGADEVRVQGFRRTGLSAGNLGFTVDSAVSRVAEQGGISGGDCTQGDKRASGRWALMGQDAGALLCSSGAAGSSAILYWTYKDAAVLVLAVNKFGDGAALLDYFQETARFIAP